MLCKEPGYKLYFWLETRRCNQCLTYWGYDVTALAGEAYPSSWTLKSLPAACQQSEVTATCRGGIPWRWCGYLGSNKVETVRSHKRNITKVHVAKIMLQRLIFNPCSCFLESEPWPPLEKPHCLPDPIPVKAVGIPWIITWKLGWFIAEEENSNFFFLPQLFLLLVPPFFSYRLPLWQSRRIASPFPARALPPHWVSKCFTSELQHSETRVCRKRKLWLTLIKFALLFPVGPQI